MLTFQNPEYTKEDLIIRLKNHRDTGSIVRDIYRDVYWDNGKGSAVGCAVESNNNYKPFDILQDRYGIPRWMGFLIENIFFCIANDCAIDFCLDVFSAIPVGVDLDDLKKPFIIFILEFCLSTFNHYNNGDSYIAVNNVIELYKNKKIT